MLFCQIFVPAHLVLYATPTSLFPARSMIERLRESVVTRNRITVGHPLVPNNHFIILRKYYTCFSIIGLLLAWNLEKKITGKIYLSQEYIYTCMHVPDLPCVQCQIREGRNMHVSCWQPHLSFFRKIIDKKTTPSDP